MKCFTDNTVKINCNTPDTHNKKNNKIYAENKYKDIVELFPCITTFNLAY